MCVCVCVNIGLFRNIDECMRVVSDLGRHEYMMLFVVWCTRPKSLLKCNVYGIPFQFKGTHGFYLLATHSTHLET